MTDRQSRLGWYVRRNEECMRKKYEEVYIPKWAQKALCIWAERSYRRGFQHGLMAAETLGMKSSSDGYKFRYDCAGGINPTDARELNKSKR